MRKIRGSIVGEEEMQRWRGKMKRRERLAERGTAQEGGRIVLSE